MKFHQNAIVKLFEYLVQTFSLLQEVFKSSTVSKYNTPKSPTRPQNTTAETHPEDLKTRDIEDTDKGGTLKLVPTEDLVDLLSNPLEGPLVDRFTDTLTREVDLILVLCFDHVLSSYFYSGL